MALPLDPAEGLRAVLHALYIRNENNGAWGDRCCFHALRVAI